MTILDPIPLEKVNPPYNELILSLQQLEVEAFAYIDPEVKDFFIQHSLECWHTTLHWVTKLKWNTKHKIPGGQAHARSIKPKGELYCCLLELCIQCHAWVGYKKAGYPDASVWFGNIWDESVALDVGYTLALVSDLTSSEKENKKARVAGIRQELRSLKDFENPYDPVAAPHLYHLIQCSLCLADKSDEFRKRYWSPYIRALANCATQLDRNPYGYYQAPVIQVEEKEGKQILRVYKREGSGKSLKCIFKKEPVSKTLAP